MPTISEQKEHRRARLSSLLKEISANDLSRITEISAAYLYQMAEGRAGQKRNINDDNARIIERAAGKPQHWLDMEENTAPKPKKPLHSGDSETVRPIGKAQNALVLAARGMAGSLTDEQAKVLTELLYVMSGLARGRGRKGD